MTTEKTFVTREFVYTGIRVDAKQKRFVTLRLIEADDVLGQEMHFDFKRDRSRVVGNVYSCEFSEDGSTVRGLERAKWVRTWPNEQDRIEWAARESQAETQIKRAKLEADAGRVSDIERIMRPLRQQYEAMRNRYDMEGVAALEGAIMSALRTPVRKSE